jgi:hypothetical protein
MFLERWKTIFGISLTTVEESTARAWCNQRRHLFITPTINTPTITTGDFIQIKPGFWLVSSQPGIQPMTRAAAKAAGLKRYFSGKTCKYHHACLRYTSNGICIDCLARSMRNRSRPDFVTYKGKVHRDDRAQVESFITALNAARGIV